MLPVRVQGIHKAQQLEALLDVAVKGALDVAVKGGGSEDYIGNNRVRDNINELARFVRL
jgi:hypothetical protein